MKFDDVNLWDLWLIDLPNHMNGYEGKNIEVKVCEIGYHRNFGGNVITAYLPNGRTITIDERYFDYLVGKYNIRDNGICKDDEKFTPMTDFQKQMESEEKELLENGGDPLMAGLDDFGDFLKGL